MAELQAHGPAPKVLRVDRAARRVAEVAPPDHEAVGRQARELVGQDVVELEALAGPLRAQALPRQRGVAPALEQRLPPELARLGVLGPTRMDYPATMAAVRAVARYVGRTLGNS